MTHAHTPPHTPTALHVRSPIPLASIIPSSILHSVLLLYFTCTSLGTSSNGIEDYHTIPKQDRDEFLLAYGILLAGSTSSRRVLSKCPTQLYRIHKQTTPQTASPTVYAAASARRCPPVLLRLHSPIETPRRTELLASRPCLSLTTQEPQASERTCTVLQGPVSWPCPSQGSVPDIPSSPPYRQSAPAELYH